jgi:general secretion pathway protein D
MKSTQTIRSATLLVCMLLAACTTTDGSKVEPGPAGANAVPSQPAVTVLPSGDMQVGPAGARPAPIPTYQSRLEQAVEERIAQRQEGAKVFPGTGHMVKQTPVTQPTAPGPEEIVLNFEGVDIRTVIETILSQYLREPYLVHPSIAGTITLRTTRGIPKKDLLPTLELLLRQNGAALVREDGLLKVMPFAMVRGSVTPQLGGVTTPVPAGFSVLVVPLKFMGAKAMEQILQPFAIEGTAVRADEVRNLVVLAGGQRELKHLLETIDLFDVDFLAGMSVGLFPIKSVDVKGLVSEIDKIFGAAANNPLAGVVRIIPIERLNALLIVTPQARYLDEAKKWIERLDKPSPGGGGLHVYQVKNGKAENLASLLSEIFGGGKSGGTSSTPQLAPGARPAEIRSPTAPGQPGQPTLPATTTTTPQTSQFSGDGVLVSKDVRVVADKDNNALLIIASQADYEKIEQALKQLDVVPRQVLVEVMIAEVTLTDELEYGINWFINARAGTSNGQANVTAGTLNVPTSSTASSGSGFPANPQTAPGAYSGLQLINTLGGDIRGILRAKGNDGKVQVLASPSIMVQDNQKATIKVGTKISVSTGSQTTGTTTGVISTISYLDTGVLLTVTPRINAGGQVTMEINQEVSSPGAAGVGGNPDVNSRSFQTSVAVNSGETLALAGLIQRNRRANTAGVPLLSKIPIIGAAFGSQYWSDNRTELVVVITPQVVANAARANEVTNELRLKMPALESLMPRKNEK